MRWPGQERAAARFARAVDAGPAAGPAASPHAGVAGLVAVVERLRSLDGTGDPAPAFRARLRERLVQTAAAEWAVGPPGVAPVEPDTGTPHPRRPWVQPRFALAGALAAVLLAGALVLASGSALPGDALYPVKRGTEWVELALTVGQEAKGRRHLALARTRAEEVRALLDRAAAGQLDAGAVAATLDAMDAATAAGSRALTTAAVRQAAVGPLTDLAGWTADQRALVAGLLDRLPPDSRARAGASLDLLRRVADRVAALRTQLSCSCLGVAAVDDLGPQPCTPCASAPGGTGSPTASIPPAGSRGRTSPSGGPAPHSGAGPGQRSGSPRPGTSGSPSAGGGGLPLPAPTGSNGLPLPSVPGLPPPTVPPPTVPAPSLPAPSPPLPSPPSPPLPSLPLPSLPLPSLPPASSGGLPVPLPT